MIDIYELLKQGEDVNLEAKTAEKAVPATIWSSYSAFANTNGGIILLGVKEEKTSRGSVLSIGGVENPDKLLSDIWNTLNNPQKISENILFEDHVYPLECEGKKIIVIEVPRASRGSRPVYTGQDMFRGSYRRNREGDYRCTKDEVLSMVRDQTDVSLDGKLIENLLISDLDEDSIRRYRIRFANIKGEHSWCKMSDEEFLCKIGAARRGADRAVHPTAAGLIFFGEFNTITNEFPNYFLDYREYLDGDVGERWSDRICASDATWSGNIFDFYFKLSTQIVQGIKNPFKLEESDMGLIRSEENAAAKAIREILANALIHADYNERRGIVIEKWPERIAISNPGSLRISPEEAIAGGISDARNAKIFNMFSLINVGERSGSGLCDAFRKFRDGGYEEPVLSENFNPARVSVTIKTQREVAKIHYGELLRGERITAGEDESALRMYGSRRGELREDDAALRSHGSKRGERAYLSKTEESVLECIKENPDVVAQEIANELSVSLPTVNRAFKKLKELGYIERIGSTRGYWRVR